MVGNGRNSGLKNRPMLEIFQEATTALKRAQEIADRCCDRIGCARPQWKNLLEEENIPNETTSPQHNNTVGHTVITDKETATQRQSLHPSNPTAPPPTELEIIADPPDIQQPIKKQTKKTSRKGRQTVVRATKPPATLDSKPPKEKNSSKKRKEPTPDVIILDGVGEEEIAKQLVTDHNKENKKKKKKKKEPDSSAELKNTDTAVVNSTVKTDGAKIIRNALDTTATQKKKSEGVVATATTNNRASSPPLAFDNSAINNTREDCKVDQQTTDGKDAVIEEVFLIGTDSDGDDLVIHDDIIQNEDTKTTTILLPPPPPSPQQHRNKKSNNNNLKSNAAVQGRVTSTLSAAAAAALKTGVPSKQKSKSISLDDPYEFTDKAAKKQFMKSFDTSSVKKHSSLSSSSSSSLATAQQKKQAPQGVVKRKIIPGLGESAKQRLARELVQEWTTPSVAAAELKKTAWHNAAMAWRMKNRPTQEEMKKQKAANLQSQKQRMTNPTSYTPADWARMSEVEESDGNPPSFATTGNTGNATSRIRGAGRGSAPSMGPSIAIEKPSAGSSEAEWRSYYKAINHAKAEGAMTFGQLLKIFKVPSEDQARVKDSYRLAVRMYHPDSNSKDRVWNDVQEKMEAEEIMKIINERKPAEL